MVHAEKWKIEEPNLSQPRPSVLLLYISLPGYFDFDVYKVVAVTIAIETGYAPIR